MICSDALDCELLQKSCRSNNFWQFDEGKGVFPTFEVKYITKYLKEVEIGRERHTLFDDSFDVTPFYPLLAFPERTNKQYKQFERRMIDAERRRNGQSITPRSEHNDIDAGFEAALAEIEGRRASSRRGTRYEASRVSMKNNHHSAVAEGEQTTKHDTLSVRQSRITSR